LPSRTSMMLRLATMPERFCWAKFRTLMENKNRKKQALRLIDEGMILAQTLMEDAETLDDLEFARMLFRSFHALKYSVMNKKDFDLKF